MGEQEILSPDEKRCLLNALRVSRDQFIGYEKMWAEVAEGGGNGMFTATAAKRLAEQFAVQAQDTSDLVLKLDAADSIVIVREG